MIGSTDFGNALVHLLQAPIEAWEDTLRTNHDDYVYVDGEEGDFGIVQYFGTGTDGKTEALLMVRYVHGGDVENTYFTDEGTRVFRELLRTLLPASIDAALLDNLNPPDGEGKNGHQMRIGEIKKAKDVREAGRVQYEPLCSVHQPERSFPDNICNGTIIKYDDLFFVTYVNTAGHLMFWCEYTKEYLRCGKFLYQTYTEWCHAFANWGVTLVHHPVGFESLIEKSL